MTLSGSYAAVVDRTKGMANVDPSDVSIRQGLVDASNQVANSGFVVGSSGNLSVRVGDRVLITPRGGRLGDLALADCVEIALDDGKQSPDQASRSRASSEERLHRNIYSATDAGAVVHTHSHFATVLSTLVEELPAIHYGITAFGGPIRVAKYATFGTPELAASVVAALKERKGALMANHGAVVTGPTIGRAVELAIQLEWMASIYYHACVLGRPTLLDPDELARVTEHSQRLNYGRTEPA